MSSWGLRKWWKWTTDKIAKQHATKQILDDSFKSISDLGFLEIKKADLILETFKIKVFDLQKNKMSDCRKQDVGLLNQDVRLQKQNVGLLKIKIYNFEE